MPPGLYPDGVAERLVLGLENGERLMSADVSG